MTNHKVTDEEIIKALELCNEGEDDACVLCPYAHTPNCYNESGKDALDLINRQKTEVDDLREIVFMDRSEAIKLLKAEAIKEFAERLCEGRVSNDPVVIAVRCLLKDEDGIPHESDEL